MSVRGETIAVNETEVGRKVEDARERVAGLDSAEVLKSVNMLVRTRRGV